MTEEVNHSERAHSALGPSAAAKWSNCAAALSAEARFLELNPDYDDSNPAAEEGTRAHELADNILQDPDFDTSGEEAEMLRHCLRYVDYCLETGVGDLNAIRATEQRLYMPGIHADAYGTGDYSVYTPSDETLHTIDFKYGQGVFVEVEGNLQLVMYAEGARHFLEKEHGIKAKKFVMHIYQPRMDNIASWEIDRTELRNKVAFLKKAALATRQIPNAYNPGEKQCQWCIAKPICKAYKNHCLQTAQEAFDDIDPDPDLAKGLLTDGIMSDEQVGDLLSRWGDITRMGEALKEYAHARALQGKKIPGYKLVDGRSSYTPNKATLEFLYGDDNDIYKEPALKSKTEMRKLIGSKVFDADMEELETYKKTTGSPTLAPEDDRRAEWVPDDYASDFDD